jgi:hypothetical protein
MKPKIQFCLIIEISNNFKIHYEKIKEIFLKTIFLR